MSVAIPVPRIVEQIRAITNLPVGYSDTNTAPEDVDDSPHRATSDRSLMSFINEAQRLIAGRAKAHHLPRLVTEFDGDLADFNSIPNVNRILHGRIFRFTTSQCGLVDCDFIRTRYRNVDESEHLENSLRVATACYPAHTWNDDILSIYPTPDRVKVTYIVEPDDITSLTGLTVLSLTIRLEGVVVAYVAAQVFKQMGDAARHQVWRQIFERRIKYFTRDWRIGPARKTRIDPLIHEEESEIE